MKTIEMSKASKTLAEYAENLSEDLIVVTSRKKPVAALVSLKGLDIEAAALSSNPRFLAILKRSYEEIQAGRVVSHDQMKKEFGSSKPKPTSGRRRRL
jgi:PHD/YefM family antitoxin component YafN of YafNO toxin-antitoxin module